MMEKMELTALKGVGRKYAELLKKLGIFTLQDLLEFYPRDYEDRGTLKTVAEADIGELAAIRVRLSDDVSERKIAGGRILTKFSAYDDTGRIELTFFNNPYIKRLADMKRAFIIYGRISGSFFKKEMTAPEIEKEEEDGLCTEIVPKYSLTAGLSQRLLRSLVKQAFEICGGEAREFLPEEILKEYGLMDFEEAIKNIHFPVNGEGLAGAKRRLSFDELFILQLGLRIIKSRREAQRKNPMKTASLDNFFKALPFSPTNAQKKAISEILSDLCGEKPMNRLLQGDVGSGKTLVAAAGAFVAAKNGIQTALMAPTEVLARQHAQTLEKMLSPHGITVGLLISAMTAKAKRELKERIKTGECIVVVGTQALIQEDVEFKKLRLVVADEQHRFGVDQRAKLLAKGDGVDLLVMSATPIPRTLGLLFYGDLDISILDELPPGRQEVSTHVVPPSHKERVFRFLEKELKSGAQGYIVCPLIEGEEERQSVLSYEKTLPNYLKQQFGIGILHGKMKSDEKRGVLSDFTENRLQLLISTTVIEVGIDVPNANIMVVEDAQQFGLSQLHQIRGRVGRGEKKSHCILFLSSESEKALERLSVLAKTRDGFKIAYEDLRLRGVGDFFGQRQHGLPSFKIADVFAGEEVIEEARRAAESFLMRGGEMSQELKEKIEKNCFFENPEISLN